MALYVHEHIFAYGSPQHGSSDLKLRDKQEQHIERLLDELELRAQAIALLMYDQAARRYSALILHPVDDETTMIRDVYWFNYQVGAAGRRQDAPPRMLLNELNFRQLQSGLERVLVQNTSPVYDVIRDGTLPDGSQMRVEPAVAAQMQAEGYDFSDHVSAMLRTREYDAALDYRTNVQQRWPWVLVYQALVRLTADARHHLVIAPPSTMLSEEEGALYAQFVRRRRDRWYVAPAVEQRNGVWSYNPLQVELDGTVYLLFMYEKTPKVATRDGVPIRLHGAGGRAIWHSAYHVQRLVQQLAPHAAEWAREALQRPRGPERDAYVGEQFRSLNFSVTLLDQLRYENDRLDSLRRSYIYALRYARAFPGERPADASPAAKMPRSGFGQLSQTQLTINQASVVLDAVRGRFKGEPSEKQLSEAMLTEYSEKLEARRQNQ